MTDAPDPPTPAPVGRSSCDDGRGGCTQLRLRGSCEHPRSLLESVLVAEAVRDANSQPSIDSAPVDSSAAASAPAGETETLTRVERDALVRSEMYHCRWLDHRWEATVIALERQLASTRVALERLEATNRANCAEYARLEAASRIAVDSALALESQLTAASSARATAERERDELLATLRRALECPCGELAKGWLCPEIEALHAAASPTPDVPPALAPETP